LRVARYVLMLHGECCALVRCMFPLHVAHCSSYVVCAAGMEANRAARRRDPQVVRQEPHLRRDWARPSHICTGTGLAPPTSVPGLGSPLPHLHRDWVHACTSAPGLGPPLPHLHRAGLGRCEVASVLPSAVADVAGVEPSPGADVVEGASPVPAQMWDVSLCGRQAAERGAVRAARGSPRDSGAAAEAGAGKGTKQAKKGSDKANKGTDDVDDCIDCIDGRGSASDLGAAAPAQCRTVASSCH
jgi:hypothetical protein